MANQPLSRIEELLEALRLADALIVNDVVAEQEDTLNVVEEQIQETDLEVVAALNALQIQTAIQDESEQVLANEAAFELTQLEYYDTKHHVEEQNPYDPNTSTEVWREYIDGIVNDMLNILPRRATQRTVEELDLEAKANRKRARTDIYERINAVREINRDEDDLSVDSDDDVEEMAVRPTSRRRLSFSSH